MITVFACYFFVRDKKGRKNKNQQNGDTSPTHSPQENGDVDKFDMPELNNVSTKDDGVCNNGGYCNSDDGTDDDNDDKKTKSV